jgi:CO dehydrogenase/acetyl-CoA synthase beta subunit
MKLFEDIIRELRTWMERMKASGNDYTEHKVGRLPWPEGERGNIVMQTDTAIELGNPRDESVSFLVWTPVSDLVRDGVSTFIGPEVSSLPDANLPFGKVVLLGVDGFTEDNCYERHREIEIVRYGMNLKGYMIRAVSQYMREWSRISREAIANGFSLTVLSSALMETYRKLGYIKSVETIFVTSTPADVRSLRPIGERAARLIGAMNKMAQELSFDCSTCDFTDVCSEVSELRSMRDALRSRGAISEKS